jgi:hypothetical protein
MATWIQRIIGASKLDAATYEEIEADRGATGQALAVVVLAAVAGGIGVSGDAGARAFVQLSVTALAAWFVWAILVWFVGTKLVPEPATHSDLGELLRTIGFSSSPGLLRILGILPGIGGLVGIITSLWMLASMIVAVRQALDYQSTGRAIAVCILGFVVYVLLLVGAAVLFGFGAAVFGGFPSRGASA